MRRFERRRFERMKQRLTVIGLSFALGALTNTALTWRLQALAETRVVVPVDPGIEHGPVATTSADEPAEIPPAALKVDDRDLDVPVCGVADQKLYDSFNAARGPRKHQAIDIMAKRGTPVVAVEDGRIEKLFTSKTGGLSIYQFEPSGAYSYYYAHLDSYARSLSEGLEVKRGEVIGYVGNTGNASKGAPHLHFAIYRLSTDRQWWKGEPLNPYPILTSR